MEIDHPPHSPAHYDYLYMHRFINVRSGMNIYQNLGGLRRTMHLNVLPPPKSGPMLCPCLHHDIIKYENANSIAVKD